MKKILFKFVLVIGFMLAFGCGVSATTAHAEEVSKTAGFSTGINDTDIVSSEEEIEQNAPIGEVETDTWFDETIKPFLIKYGADVVAFLTVAFIALKDTQKTKQALFGAVNTAVQSYTENKNTVMAVQELKEAFAEEMSRLKEEHAEEIKAMQELFVQAVEAIRESVAVKVDDIDDVAHKLLDVEKLAYGNNAHLVSNGTAKRIAEVIGNGKTNDKK